MDLDLPQLLTALYIFIVPAVTTLGYLPQVRKLWRTRNAEGLSLGSWLLWILSSAISVLYVLVVVEDLALLVVSAMHLAFCTIISAQIVRFRRRGASGAGTR